MSGLGMVESVRWWSGRVWFADWTAGTIHAVTPEGSDEVVWRHESLPLDFGDAHFFDEAYDALVCVQHGARYRPDDGVCFEGPCAGARLTALSLVERDGGIWCAGRAVREEAHDEA